MSRSDRDWIVAGQALLLLLVLILSLLFGGGLRRLEGRLEKLEKRPRVLQTKGPLVRVELALDYNQDGSLPHPERVEKMAREVGRILEEVMPR